jgi:serine protease
VGNADYVWAASTADPRALQKPANPADRIAAAWYAANTFSVDLNLSGTHQVALYLLDWDGGGRSEQIDVLDAVSGKLLSSQTVGGFGGGEYLVWDLGGNVLVRITKQSGPNAVLSGLFFDPAAPA